MKNLEDMIRDVAKRGDMTHLSLVPVAGKGPGNIAWAATFAPAARFGLGRGHHVDPVEAMKLAMTDTRVKGVVPNIRKTLEKSESPRAKEAASALTEIVDDSDFV